MEDSERIFTELIRSIERRHSELIRLIRDKEKQAVSRAEGRLERLEQEINDLRRRDAELEQLSHTQNHIQFLQVTQILKNRIISRFPLLGSVSQCFKRAGPGRAGRGGAPLHFTKTRSLHASLEQCHATPSFPQQREVIR